MDDRRYRWIIVLAGMMGLFASLGLGRFSLGMMLPAMGAGLQLKYSQMGLVSTINFCGYLAAVLLCGRLSRLLGARLLIFLALLAVGMSMVLIGRSNSLTAVALLYCITGIGSALSNVPIMALISTWFPQQMRGRAAGLCVMGNGLGIVLSGRAVPLFNDVGQGWRLSWLVLGGVVLFIALASVLLIRNQPAGPSSLQVSKPAAHVGKGGRAAVGRSRQPEILHCAALYFLFGFTYVIYITFMVTFLVQERGMSEYGAGQLWSWVGVLSLGSGPLFGYISDRFGRKFALMLVFSIQTAAYLLAGLSLPMVAVYLSVGCFAVVAWSIPSIMAALVGDYVGHEGAAAAFGFVTFVFGLGQIGGPAVAGVLAEMSGSFATSFLLAAGLTCTGVILSSRLR